MVLLAILAFFTFCAATYVAAFNLEGGLVPVKENEEALAFLEYKLTLAEANGNSNMVDSLKKEIKEKKEELDIQRLTVKTVQLFVWAVRIAAWIGAFIIAVSSLVKGIGNPIPAYAGLVAVLFAFVYANFSARKSLEKASEGKTPYPQNRWLQRLTDAVMGVYSFYIFLALIGVSF